MANILIVEDNSEMQDLYQFFLGGHTVFRALTVAKARNFFNDHQDQIAVIVLDGHMGLDDPERTTLEFALHARRMGFRGPMIACSGDEGLRANLLERGCSHTVPKDKVGDLIEELFCVAV